MHLDVLRHAALPFRMLRHGVMHALLWQVSGSGKKVRPQKGGGTARAGHSRPPQWRGGAVAHGPKPRDWSYKLNKKERRLGLCVALSSKVAEGNLVVVDGIAQATGRTADLAAKLSSRGWADATVILPAGEDTTTGAEDSSDLFLQAAANMPRVNVLPQLGANVYDLLKREKVVLTKAAVRQLEARLLAPVRRRPWE